MSKVNSSGPLTPCIEKPAKQPERTERTQSVPAKKTTDVWESSAVGTCMAAAKSDAAKELQVQEKQVKRLEWRNKAWNALVFTCMAATAGLVALELVAPWFLPCAVGVLTLGLVFSAQLRNSLREQELLVARKDGEVAMAHKLAQQLRPARVRDALLPPGHAAV